MPGRHSPRQNHLLAALPAEVYARLLPELKIVPLLLGSPVYEAGDRMEKMEAHVCECYAVVKTEFDRLLPRKKLAFPAAVSL